MRSRARVLAAALALAGCGAGRAGQGLDVPSAEAPETSGLVWVRDVDSGYERTLWVSVEDGSPLAGHAIEGPVWADGRALWQYLEETVERPVFDEEPAADAGDPGDATGHARVTRAVLRELVEDARIVVVEAPSVGPAREIRHRLALEGSVGPYLFFVQQLYVDSWAAHGTTDASALVWDLRAAAPTEILTEREVTTWTAEARARAREELGGLSEPQAYDQVRLVALHPRWHLDQGLRVQLHATLPVCHACSDGDWSDSTVSLRFDAPRTPERLDARLPAWARAAARREGAQLLGFTRVEHLEPVQILDSLSR